MITLIKTDSQNINFIELVKALDLDLKIRDGEDHGFYAQFNKIDLIPFVVLAYSDQLAVGCGAIKHYSSNTVEVKRMYVRPEKRGKGIAAKILAELELWARELNYENCILETGKNQPEAISLYHKCGYKVIPNYDQYALVENSVCFQKVLI